MSRCEPEALSHRHSGHGVVRLVYGTVTPHPGADSPARPLPQRPLCGLRAGRDDPGRSLSAHGARVPPKSRSGAPRACGGHSSGPEPRRSLSQRVSLRVLSGEGEAAIRVGTWDSGAGLMTKPCAVKWCISPAVEGAESCVLHLQYPDLHPVEPEPEELETAAEVFITWDGKATTGTVKIKCKKCHGTGKCEYCEGEGTFERECSSWRCSDTHHCECEECDGSGECEDCNGSGRDEEAERIGHRDPQRWRWVESYRQAKSKPAH